MLRKFRLPFLIVSSLIIVLLAVIYFQNVTVDVLQPKGIIGIKQKDLLIYATLLMLIVVIPVFVLIGFVLWKYRVGRGGKYTPDWDNSHLAEALWWGIPFIIIIILSVMTWFSSHELDPYRPLDNGTKPVRIQVVALPWKWLFLYPEEQIATVNYIEIPVGRTIDFDITGDAPMNSFWIPQLGGQIYAMTGMTTKLYLIADEPGDYNGLSAHISGEGFAGMMFLAKARSQSDYDAWVAEAQNSSQKMTSEEYQELLKPSKYNPEATYKLEDQDLFRQIVMKYMTPEMHGSPAEH